MANKAVFHTLRLFEEKEIRIPRFSSAAVFVTKLFTVFLHKIFGIITKAKSMAIDIDGIGLSFHLVESPGVEPGSEEVPLTVPTV